MKRSKKRNQSIHAKRRALERYDLDINRKSRMGIISLIQNNHTIERKKQSNRVTIHTLNYNGKIIKVVYDKDRKNIVTFLPIDNLT